MRIERAGKLTTATAKRVLFASIAWATVVLAVWVVAIFVIGGGPIAVNLVVLGLVALGPILGGIAGGGHILASFVAGLLVPRLPRDILAALFGWGAACALWGLLTFGGSDRATVAGSVVVAAIGAVLNFIIVRSRQGPS